MSYQADRPTPASSNTSEDVFFEESWSPHNNNEISQRVALRNRHVVINILEKSGLSLRNIEDLLDKDPNSI